MGENKYITNKESVLKGINKIRTVQIGIVASTDDPLSLGRIKVRVPGQTNVGGDGDTPINELPWSHPMVPKFFTAPPKVDEAVYVLTFSNQLAHSDRLYLGPIISQLNKLNLDPLNITGLNGFTFATTNPDIAFDRIPAINGVFPKKDDIAIQGRYNTDIILRKNEILIRAGKFVESKADLNNPFTFQFNNTTQGFIQIKNNINLTRQQGQDIGSVTNIVGSKINLITHKDGAPRFNVMNQDTQISDEEILNILENAHPLPFGDLLVQYLILLKNAFLNHVHNYNGKPPTDLTVGNALPVKDFNTKAEDLENRMLSKNIRIN
jgi:hypothetical protein